MPHEFAVRPLDMWFLATVLAFLTGDDFIRCVAS